jgi:hypothetical protein
MSNITTKFFSKKVSESFISEISGNVYYFAVGRAEPWTNENSPDLSIDTTKAVNDFKRHVLFGKRIKPDAIINLVQRYFWMSGTVYAQYDDIDADLYAKPFYVINSYNNVYKCLFNNNGVPSTSEPTLVQTSTFSGSDGYVWKYMYTLSSANNSKFSTSAYMAVEPNTSVTSAASNGAIDIVLVTNPGVGYTGYVTGYIKSVISNTVFQIESSSVLSVDNFYYNTSGFYIAAGTGEGQLTTISNYIVNSSGHYVYTADAIASPALDLTSQFRIAPQILITGDGTGAKAFCTVNTFSYSIDKITMLSTGNNYSYANVSIIANPTYGTGAAARAIIPPFGGHGADTITELGSRLLGISVFFTNTESNTISTEVSFRQGGIITAPKKYTAPVASITFNANTNVSNTYDSISILNANTNFKSGDLIQYVVSAGNTAVSGLSNGSFYYVVSSNTTAIQLSNTLDGAAINITSGATETGHTLYSNSLMCSTTFNALTILNITTGTSTFSQNEVILGSTSGATGYVAFANSTVAKITMIQGNFFANSSFGETITGTTSSVSATINPGGINNPDISPLNFRVMHVDNVEYIQRSNTSNEQGYLIVTL